jgi:hypothetical protein
MTSKFIKAIGRWLQEPWLDFSAADQKWIEQQDIDALAQKEAKKVSNLVKKEANKAKKEAEMAKLPPKELATAKGEPWVAVLETHVNKDNIRNGFFELDWNDLFIVKLRQEGYGFDGDPAEEIVDRWFRDLARNMLISEGQDPNTSVGSLDVSKLK